MTATIRASVFSDPRWPTLTLYATQVGSFSLCCDERGELAWSTTTYLQADRQEAALVPDAVAVFARGVFEQYGRGEFEPEEEQ